jgi:hypothetical protein
VVLQTDLPSVQVDVVCCLLRAPIGFGDISADLRGVRDPCSCIPQRLFNWPVTCAAFVLPRPHRKILKHQTRWLIFWASGHIPQLIPGSARKMKYDMIILRLQCRRAISPTLHLLMV